VEGAEGESVALVEVGALREQERDETHARAPRRVPPVLALLLERHGRMHRSKTQLVAHGGVCPALQQKLDRLDAALLGRGQQRRLSGGIALVQRQPFVKQRLNLHPAVTTLSFGPW